MVRSWRSVSQSAAAGPMVRRIPSCSWLLPETRGRVVASLEQEAPVFDAHARAYEFYRGACTRGIYDNMKTARDRICRQGPPVQPPFPADVRHRGVRPRMDDLLWT